MRSLRDSFLGQLVLGAIVVAIIVAFAIGGMQGGGGSTFGSECAARVGSSCIDPKEYTAAYGLVVSVGLNDRAVQQLDLKRQVARGLVEREVLLREAKALGISASETAIDEDLISGRARVSLPAEGRERLAMSLALCLDDERTCAPGTIGLRALPVLQKGAFEYARYERVVRRTTGRSPNHFKEMQVREATAERVRELITEPVRVSEEEAFLSLERTQSKAVARVLTIHRAWFERYVRFPSEADIKSFVSSHEKEIGEATKAAASRFQPGCPVVQEFALKTGGTESDEAVEKKLRSLLPRLKDAAAREALIRKESEADSAAVGGRLGCLDARYGAGSEELLTAAGKLEKPGEMTDVVRTPRGFHVLWLEDRVTAETSEALARAFVSYELSSRALGIEEARKFADLVLATIATEPSLEAATEKVLSSFLASGQLGNVPLALTDESRPKTDVTAPFSIEDSPVEGASGTESPAQLVFDMKEPGEITKTPVPLTDGFALLQLKEKEPYTREKFEKERDDILPILRRRKAEQVLADYVAELIEKAGGASYDDRYAPSASATTKPENAG